MLLGKHSRRRDVGNGGLDLVLQAADDVAVAAHHRVPTCLGDIGRIVLFLLPDLGIEHIGALEEPRFGRAGHQAGHRDVGVLEFVAQREGKTVHEGLGAVVDGLEASPA